MWRRDIYSGITLMIPMDYDIYEFGNGIIE